MGTSGGQKRTSGRRSLEALTRPGCRAISVQTGARANGLGNPFTPPPPPPRRGTRRPLLSRLFDRSARRWGGVSGDDRREREGMTMLEHDHAQENGNQRSERLDFAVRHRKLDWRYEWWLNGRTADDRVMKRILGRALDRKREMVERQRGKADHRAAYGASASAGSPWITIGPRNVNGRVKCLAVHPTDPQTVYAGAASGGVWKSVDGG